MAHRLKEKNILSLQIQGCIKGNMVMVEGRMSIPWSIWQGMDGESQSVILRDQCLKLFFGRKQEDRIPTSNPL
jgi:hypothetical protein